MSVATDIAEQFDNDGQRFESFAGDFETVCDARAAGTLTNGDATIYRFEDGSALLVHGDVWDFVADDCDAFCGAEQGCRCGR